MLAQSYLLKGHSPQAAVENTLARLKGAFALCFLFEGEEDLMIAARHGSPLAIGYGDGEMFVGSDAIALAPMTNRSCYLEEGDYAVINRSGAEIFGSDGALVNREIRVIRGDQNRIDKDGFTHFMEKEIYQQPSELGAA